MSRQNIEVDGFGGDDLLCPRGFENSVLREGYTICSSEPLGEEELAKIDEDLGGRTVPQMQPGPTITLQTTLTGWTDDDEIRSCGERVEAHELYRVRVRNVSSTNAMMDFEKCQGTNPSMDLAYWLLLAPGPDVEEEELDTLPVLSQGSWERTSNRLTVSGFMPFSEEELVIENCGQQRFVMFVTDGGDRPGQRAWFANASVPFILECQ